MAGESLMAKRFSQVGEAMIGAALLIVIGMLLVPLPAALIDLTLVFNMGLSLGIFLLKTFFDQMPKELEDAARIDGCGKFGIYWHVALPLAKPAIAVVTIFTALTAWNEFFFANLIFNDKNLMPLQKGLMMFRGEHLTNYPLLMAGVTIATVPIILLYLFMQKDIISGITAGAIK